MVNCLVFSICYFWLHKIWCLQKFCLIKKWVVLEIFDKSVSKIMTLPNNLVLICRFQAIILHSVHSIWFVKYKFSAKLWFMKTSTRILKFESWVIKLIPDCIKLLVKCFETLHMLYFLVLDLYKFFFHSPYSWAICIFDSSSCTSLCLNKQGSKYAKVLNMPDIVHRLGSLCKILSFYWNKGVLKTFFQTAKIEFCGRTIMPIN